MHFQEHHIVAFPRTSHSHKISAKWSRDIRKLEDSLTVYCEMCEDTIEIPSDSSAAQSFAEGGLVREEAIKLILGAHERHEHTDYDEIRISNYEKNRQAGMSWEDAHQEARDEVRRDIKL